jgi:uncharacterized protein YkwD
MPTLITPVRERALARTAAGLLAGFAAFLAAPGGAAAQGACAGSSVAPTAGTLHRAAGATVCLVNAERARHGLHPLRRNRDLRQAAGRHARNMVRRGFFSHASSRGAGLNQRLRRSGYARGKRAGQAGEALAWGAGAPSSPDVIVAGWIASPRHHRVLLGRDFRDIGVGLAPGAPRATTGDPGVTYTLDTGVRRR